MAGPAFNFSQYPTTQDSRSVTTPTTYGSEGAGGLSGNNQTAPMAQQTPDASVWGTTPGGSYSPYGGGATTSQGAPPGVDGAPAIPPAAGYGAQFNGGNAPTSGAQDPQAYYQSLFPQGSRVTPQDLLAHEQDLKAHGITLIKNAEGLPGKISLADGSAFDVIQGAGTGNGISQWNQIAGPGGVPTGGGGGMGSLNQFGQGMGFMTAPIGQFTPPSAQDALNSPGSQYAIDEAMRTMQNSAAAKGSLLNGRVLQAENNAILNQAAGQYGDVFGRALQTYGTNYQTQTGNQDRPFSKYLSLSDLGQRAASAS